MKRSLVLLVIVGLFGLSYCPVMAGLSVDTVDGQSGTGKIAYGVPITFHILWDGNEYPGCDVTNASNGYRLYSPTGTPFTSSGQWNPGIDWDSMFDGGTFASQSGGGGVDTVAFSGFRLFMDGIPSDFYNVAHLVSLEPFPISAVGGEICIDSSSCPP